MLKENETNLVDILNEAGREMFHEERIEMLNAAKQAIQKLQEENKRTYNKKRNTARDYKDHDIVYIPKTQFGTQNKLHLQYLGPYQVMKTTGKDRYEVRRVGQVSQPVVPIQ